MHVVLWAYHTMPHSLIQETLYRLVYRAYAMISIELFEPSPRIIIMTYESNEVARRVKLDLIEEDNEKARVKE